MLKRSQLILKVLSLSVYRSIVLESGLKGVVLRVFGGAKTEVPGVGLFSIGFSKEFMNILQ